MSLPPANIQFFWKNLHYLALKVAPAPASPDLPEYAGISYFRANIFSKKL